MKNLKKVARRVNRLLNYIEKKGLKGQLSVDLTPFDDSNNRIMVFNELATKLKDDLFTELDANYPPESEFIRIKQNIDGIECYALIKNKDKTKGGSDE